jgi:hypothetical protein
MVLRMIHTQYMYVVRTHFSAVPIHSTACQFVSRMHVHARGGMQGHGGEGGGKKKLYAPGVTVVGLKGPSNAKFSLSTCTSCLKLEISPLTSSRNALMSRWMESRAEYILVTAASHRLGADSRNWVTGSLPMLASCTWPGTNGGGRGRGEAEGEVTSVGVG